MIKCFTRAQLVGTGLRVLRTKRGRQLAKFADKLVGISAGRLSNIERAYTKCPVDQLMYLLSELDMQYDEFFTVLRHVEDELDMLFQCTAVVLESDIPPGGGIVSIEEMGTLVSTILAEYWNRVDILDIPLQ